MIRLRFLGPPRLDGEPMRRKRAAALAAYLAATGQPHTRDHLAALFWPDAGPTEARARLRRALHELHGDLGEGALRAEGDQVELLLDSDLREFRATGPAREAAALYGDDFLQGFSLPDAEEFEEWAARERETLRREFASVLARLADETGDPDEALRAAHRAIALDPLDEAAHRRVMRLHARAGQRGAAQAQFEALRRRLAEELGAEPEAETVELARSLRTETPPSAGPERTPVRFVASAGLHIAWQSLGSGPPDLAIIPGFVSHLECAWEDPVLAGFLETLAASSRVLLFDKRGVGLSDRVGAPPLLEDTVGDLLAVLDAAGSRRAVLLGISEGGPAACLAAAAHPDRVAGLILYGSLAKGSRSEDAPWAARPDQFDRWHATFVEGWGGPVSVEMFAPSRSAEPRFREWWARLLRLASSPGGLKGVIEVLRDLDVRDILPTIRVPTLVLHRTDDRAIRVEAGRDLASRIPGARLVELPGRDHWCWAGDLEPLLREIGAFLQDFGEAAEPDLRLAAVACLRLASAARGTRAEAWTRIFGESLARHRGQAVRLESHEGSALFDGPTRAVAFAREVVDRLGAAGVACGAGVHAGECRIRGGRVDGAAPDRARALAGNSGEVLASGTVRDLAVGSGLRFTPRGDGFTVA